MKTVARLLALVSLPFLSLPAQAQENGPEAEPCTTECESAQLDANSELALTAQDDKGKLKGKKKGKTGKKGRKGKKGKGKKGKGKLKGKKKKGKTGKRGGKQKKGGDETPAFLLE